MKNIKLTIVAAIAVMSLTNASAVENKSLEVVSAENFKIENLTWRYKPQANTCVLEDKAEIYTKFYKTRCTVYTHNTLRTGYVAECKNPENQLSPISIYASAKNKQDCLFTGKNAKFALKIAESPKL